MAFLFLNLKNMCLATSITSETSNEIISSSSNSITSLTSTITSTTGTISNAILLTNTSTFNQLTFNSNLLGI